MYKEIEYTWKEIYKDWGFEADRLPIINEKLVVNEIPIENFKRPDEALYGLDWIQNELFASRTEGIKENPHGFLLFGDSLNKGTLTTLQYLVMADDQETRAAIWIYAFLRDVLQYRLDSWRGDVYRIASAMQSAAFSILREKNLVWHHSMRKLMPEICFSRILLDSIKIEDKSEVMELIALAVDYVIMHYKVAWYDSRPIDSKRDNLYYFL